MKPARNRHSAPESYRSAPIPRGAASEAATPNPAASVPTGRRRSRSHRPRRYSPAVPGADRRQGLTAGRLLLATGLLISAALLSFVGGGWGLAFGASQAALGVAALLRPRSPLPLAGALLLLVPAPLAAIRHWTARLPGACRCARLPKPPPGLVSLTGLAVTLDLALLGLALWLAAADSKHRHAEVVRSSP